MDVPRIQLELPILILHVGFRVASIPEPSTGLLVMTGLLGLAYRKRWHGRAT